MTLDDLRATLALPNVAAFLRVIREGESSQDDSAYRMRYHPTQRAYFEGFDRHPRIFEPIPGKTLKSSAAGPYQITATTWDDLCRSYAFPDFSPPSQDLACVALLYRRDAVAPLLAGDLATAIARCRQEWTSLPGAAENRRVTMARAEAVFRQYGGTLAADQPGTQPAAPIVDADPSRRIIIEQEQESPMSEPQFTLGGTLKAAAGPVALANPIIGGALGIAGALVDAFSPLVKEKVTTALGRSGVDPVIAGQVGDSLIASAKILTKKDDPYEAVVEARRDRAIMAQLEGQALDKLAELAPLLDKVQQWQVQSWEAEEASRAAAAARQERDTHGVVVALADRAFYAYAGAVLALAAICGLQIWFAPDHKPNETLVGAFILLLGAGSKQWEKLYDYYFGTSRSSAAKDTVISEMAARRRGQP